MSGPATSTGFGAAGEPLGELGDRVRVGAGAAARPRRAIAWAGRVGSGASTVQSSIGIETKAGPFGASAAVWIARPIAAGTSSARGGS